MKSVSIIVISLSRIRHFVEATFFVTRITTGKSIAIFGGESDVGHVEAYGATDFHHT